MCHNDISSINENGIITFPQKPNIPKHSLLIVSAAIARPPNRNVEMCVPESIRTHTFTATQICKMLQATFAPPRTRYSQILSFLDTKLMQNKPKLQQQKSKRIKKVSAKQKAALKKKTITKNFNKIEFIELYSLIVNGIKVKLYANQVELQQHVENSTEMCMKYARHTFQTGYVDALHRAICFECLCLLVCVCVCRICAHS